MAVRNSTKPAEKQGNVSTVAEEFGKHAHYLINLVAKDLDPVDVELIAREGDVDATEARLVAERVTERLSDLVLKDATKDYEGIGTLPGIHMSAEYTELGLIVDMVKELTGPTLFTGLISKLKEELPAIKTALQDEHTRTQLLSVFNQIKDQRPKPAPTKTTRVSPPGGGFLKKSWDI